jgi:hypothetical protein
MHSQSRFARLGAMTPDVQRRNVEYVEEILTHLGKTFCNCGCKYQAMPGFLTAAAHKGQFWIIANVLAKLFRMSPSQFVLRFKSFDKNTRDNKKWLYQVHRKYNEVFRSQCEYCKSGFFKLQMVWKCLKFFKQNTPTIDAEKTFCYFKRILSYYYKGRVDDFNKFGAKANSVIYVKTSLSFTDWNNIFPESHFKKKVEKKEKVSIVDAIAEHRLEQMLKKQRARQGRSEKMEREFPEEGYVLSIDCFDAVIRYAVVFHKKDGKTVLTWCEISDALGKSGGGGSGRNRTSKKSFSLQAQMNLLKPGKSIRFKERERPVGFDDIVAKEHLRDMLVKLGREHYGTVIEARHNEKSEGFKDAVDAECLEKFRLKVGFPKLEEIVDIQFGVTTNQKSQVGEREPLFTELTAVEREQQAIKVKNLRRGLPENYREQKAEKLAKVQEIQKKKEEKEIALVTGGIVGWNAPKKAVKPKKYFGLKKSAIRDEFNVNIGSQYTQAIRSAAKQNFKIWGMTSCAGGEADPYSSDDEDDDVLNEPDYTDDEEEDDELKEEVYEPELLSKTANKVKLVVPTFTLPINKPLGEIEVQFETISFFKKEEEKTVDDGWTEVKHEKKLKKKKRNNKWKLDLAK